MEHVITAIVKISANKYRIVLDYEEEFSLYKGEISRFHIEEGGILTDSYYKEIMTEILPKRARERCLNMLAARSMTEQEIISKLRDGYYPECIIEHVIGLLHKHHLIDDADYAQSFINTRKNAKSRKQIQQDLIRRGVAPDTIRNALEECFVDEESNIRLLMQKKRINPEEAAQEELQKFAAFLFRKGYDYDLIRRVIFR